MSEDLGDHGGVFDGGDDLQRAAGVRALFNIDIEHPFEQPCPADAEWRPVVGWVAVNLCGVIGIDRDVGDDRETVLGVRREHAIIGSPSSFSDIK